MGCRKGTGTLRGGGGMKKFIPTLALLIGFITSCKPVNLNAPIPDFDTGIDPDSWVTIPSGEFFLDRKSVVRERVFKDV